MSEEIMYNDCPLHTLFILRVPFLKLVFLLSLSKKREKYDVRLCQLYFKRALLLEVGLY